jgi:hypothetical protein
MLTQDEKLEIQKNKEKLTSLSPYLQTKLKAAIKNKTFSFEQSDGDICCDTQTGPHGFVRCSEDNCINFLGGTVVGDANCPQ